MGIGVTENLPLFQVTVESLNLWSDISELENLIAYYWWIPISFQVKIEKPRAISEWKIYWTQVILTGFLQAFEFFF